MPSKFLKKAKKIEDGEYFPPRKKKPYVDEPDDGETIWLLSYADLMTLLCAFFIMLLSMATINAPEYEEVKKEVAEHFGGEYHSASEELAKFVTQIIQEAGIDKEMVVVSQPTGVSIVFHSKVFFDSLSAYLRKPGRAVLDKLITAVAEKQGLYDKQYKVVVEGHTDGKPIVSGIYPSNWELSSARAAQVVRMFIRAGFKSKDIMAIGYADTRPQYQERSPAGEWLEEAVQKNRRVVIRILEPLVDAIPWQAAILSTASPSPTPETANPTAAPPSAAPSPQQ